MRLLSTSSGIVPNGLSGHSPVLYVVPGQPACTLGRQGSVIEQLLEKGMVLTDEDAGKALPLFRPGCFSQWRQ